jgi:hydrogenase maturation protein HypF
MATTSQSAAFRYRIRLRGIVQGVGFRPFIYKLATRLRVGGFILNSSSGITIEAEGSDSAIEQFFSALRSHPPPLAQIGEITSEELQPTGESRFEIRESLAADGEFALVSGHLRRSRPVQRQDHPQRLYRRSWHGHFVATGGAGVRRRH